MSTRLSISEIRDKSDQDDSTLLLQHIKDNRFSTFKVILFNIFQILFISGFSYGWSRLFLLPYCNILFRCGCTWEWAGGIEHCNIFDNDKPHCPWCSANANVAWIPTYGTDILMVVGSVIIGGFWMRRRLNGLYLPMMNKSYTDFFKESGRIQEYKLWLWRLFFIQPIVAVIIFWIFGLINAFFFFKIATGYPYFLWIGP